MAGNLQKCRFRGVQGWFPAWFAGKVRGLGLGRAPCAAPGASHPPFKPPLVLLQRCWDCKWDAEALDTLGGP